VSQNASLRSAEILPAGWLPVGPRPLGLAFAVLAGSGLLVLTVRAGVPARLRERPLAASLALVMSASLLPHPAWAGGPPIFGNGGNTWVPRWLVHDPLGSGLLILDASGGIVQQREFEPFGGVLSQSPPTEANPRLFTGQRLIGTTGLYDFKARWYDPEVGRFLAVDPLLPAPGDPQTHNPYPYVNNDPVNLTDPDGRCLDGCIIEGIIWLIVYAAISYVSVNIDSWVSTSGGVPPPAEPSGLSQLVPAAARTAEGAGAVAQATEGAAEGVSDAKSSDVDSSGVTREEAEGNLRRAQDDIIGDLESGELDLGINEGELASGLRGIKIILVENIVDAAADITTKETTTIDGKTVFTSVEIRVDYGGARTLGEAYDSLGHELRHLAPRNRAQSGIDPDKGGPLRSPRENNADRWGAIVRKRYGH